MKQHKFGIVMMAGRGTMLGVYENVHRVNGKDIKSGSVDSLLTFMEPDELAELKTTVENVTSFIIFGNSLQEVYPTVVFSFGSGDDGFEFAVGDNLAKLWVKFRKFMEEENAMGEEVDLFKERLGNIKNNMVEV